jgi:hypothetical protein
VKLWEIGVAAIKRVGSEWRSEEHPFVEILRQDQIASGSVLGYITRRGLRVATGERLCEHGYHNHATRN